MAQRVARRKIAAYYAEQLIAGKKDIAKQLAAYLVETHRVRELDLIVRDIESALAERGVLVADITSSRPLSETSAKEIRAYLTSTTKADTIQLRTRVNPELLGGVQIATPGHELDATLRYKLNQLKASKI